MKVPLLGACRGLGSSDIRKTLALEPLLLGPRLITSNPTVQGPGFAFVALVIRAYLDDPIGVSGTCSIAHNDVSVFVGLS